MVIVTYKSSLTFINYSQVNSNFSFLHGRGGKRCSTFDPSSIMHARRRWSTSKGDQLRSTALALWSLRHAERFNEARTVTHDVKPDGKAVAAESSVIDSDNEGSSSSPKTKTRKQRDKMWAHFSLSDSNNHAAGLTSLASLCKNIADDCASVASSSSGSNNLDNDSDNESQSACSSSSSDYSERYDEDAQPMVRSSRVSHARRTQKSIVTRDVFGQIVLADLRCRRAYQQVNRAVGATTFVSCGHRHSQLSAHKII